MEENRYLDVFIEADLEKKMVFLSGPRQAGKTTFAKKLSKKANGEYFNWDIRKDQKIIKNISWDKSKKIIVLDEIHKFIKWKNFLKGLYDEYKGVQHYLVTGSAKLDTFKKQGDALTGRYYSYRMHPVDIIEGMTFLDKKKLTVQESLKRVMKTGGFPESFDYPADSERLRNHRFDLVLQEDLRDLSKVNSIKGMSYLIELLRERVGSTINYQNLAEDLSVSAPTIKSWIELLERLYVIYIVKPYSKGLARSIKKDSKIYFYDTAAALNGDGAILENTVASSLLKFIDFEEDTKGIKGSLHFYRDKEKREIDFVIVQNNKIKYLIEVKNSDDNLHRPLLYLKEKLKLPQGHAFQLVLNISRNQEVNGVKICDLAKWFEQNIKFKNK